MGKQQAALTIFKQVEHTLLETVPNPLVKRREGQKDWEGILFTLTSSRSNAFAAFLTLGKNWNQNQGERLCSGYIGNTVI